MIYNLVKYCMTVFPTLAIYSDAWDNNSVDDSIKISDTGGEVDHNNGRIDASVQIMSRSKNRVDARTNIELVFQELKNRFGLLLPEVTVDSVVYPQVKTYQIVPMQNPGYLGATEESYHLYSFNVVITLNYS